MNISEVRYLCDWEMGLRMAGKARDFNCTIPWTQKDYSLAHSSHSNKPTFPTDKKSK